MMRRKRNSGKRILQCPNPIAMASGSDVPPSGKMMGDAIHGPVAEASSRNEKKILKAIPEDATDGLVGCKYSPSDKAFLVMYYSDSRSEAKRAKAAIEDMGWGVRQTKYQKFIVLQVTLDGNVVSEEHCDYDDGIEYDDEGVGPYSLPEEFEQVKDSATLNRVLAEIEKEIERVENTRSMPKDRRTRLTTLRDNKAVIEDILGHQDSWENGGDGFQFESTEFSDDDGPELVNTEDDGGRQYKIGLWWGSGYMLDTYRAWAFSEEEALNHVVAYIERKHPQWLKESDECASDLMKEYDEESPEFQETFMYVDATMEGADEPHYIWAENLCIEKL